MQVFGWLMLVAAVSVSAQAPIDGGCTLSACEDLCKSAALPYGIQGYPDDLVDVLNYCSQHFSSPACVPDGCVCDASDEQTAHGLAQCILEKALKPGTKQSWQANGATIGKCCKADERVWSCDFGCNNGEAPCDWWESENFTWQQSCMTQQSEEKKPVRFHEQLTMFCLWASGTMNTSCFATGFLRWEFGLSLKQSLVIIIFASLLGCALTGFAATFGAVTGLTNFCFPIGWSAVACITAGLALQAVADGHLSLVVGIIILAAVALIISFVGLSAILIYERYAWVVFFIIFMIFFFGEAGKYADNTTPASVSGINQSGAVLTLIAIIYGSSCSWCTMASDYYVHYPASISRVKVFLMTTFGIAIPTSIGMFAGAVVASTFNNQPEWKTTYENDGIGFSIQDFLYPRGFAKFLLTLLVLSGINTNVISIYSAAISCQQFARPFSKIPPFIWTLLVFACILGLALGGREKLNAYLQNFLGLLGDWCTSYFIILFSKHFLFRGGNFDNYDLDGWNDPDRLPLSLAAGASFGLGIIGWVIGMDQTWFLGPVAKLISSTGGDVGNELTFVITLITFIPFRFLEKRYIGR